MIKRLAKTKLGKSALAALTALTLNSTKAYADNNPAIDTAPVIEYSEPVVYESEQMPDNPQQIEPLDVIVQGAFAYGIKIFLHEFGHYAAARSLGFEAHMQGPRIGEDPKIAYTLVEWGNGASNDEHIFISSAGAGLTTITNLLLTNYLANTDTNNSARPFLASLSFAMALDRYTYVTNTAFLHFFFRNSDFNDTDKVLDNLGIERDAGYAMLLAGTMAEAALRWREFAYLYQTAIGNNPEYKPSGLVFSVLPTNNTVTFNVGGRF